MIASLLSALAQERPAPDPCAATGRPAFDVVSIKASQTSSHSSSPRGTPDGVIVVGSLRRLTERLHLHDKDRRQLRHPRHDALTTISGLEVELAAKFDRACLVDL